MLEAPGNGDVNQDRRLFSYSLAVAGEMVCPTTTVAPNLALEGDSFRV